MADSPLAVWSVFIGGILTAVILLSGFVAVIMLSQRRFLNLHRTFSQRILKAQEDERTWVSREVHDDAVQRVALIGRECEAIRGSSPALPAEQDEQLAAIQEELRDLSETLRDLAHKLHPPLLEKGGLAPALVELGEEFQEAHGIRLNCTVPQQTSGIPSQAAIALYRIAQESLQNVAKHAGSPAASLELALTRFDAVLTIKDSGRGFEANGRPRGIGLIGMRERATLAGGELVVRSTPGAGTTVMARVPLSWEDTGAP